MKRKFYRRTAFFLLTLFVSYWCGVTLFTHSHKVNGIVVVHSHPFKAEHSHSSIQFETISFISSIVTTGIFQFGTNLVQCDDYLTAVIESPVTLKFKTRSVRCIRWRAPPYTM